MSPHATVIFNVIYDRTHYAAVDHVTSKMQVVYLIFKDPWKIEAAFLTFSEYRIQSRAGFHCQKSKNNFFSISN